MPFAGYSSFADCEKKNQDKRDPAAYCADIKRRTEDKSIDSKFNYNFLFKSAKTQDEKKTGRIIEGIASVEEIDRDDEVIMMSAIKNSVVDFMKNPVIRYGHTTPVGKALDARVEDNKFYIKAYITDQTIVGKEVCALIDEGIIKSYSVAGKILDKNTKFDKELNKDITYINKMELYEVSVCDLPANRNSFFNTVAKSLNTDKEDKPLKDTLGSMRNTRDEVKNKKLIDMEKTTKEVEEPKEEVKVEPEKEEVKEEPKPEEKSIDVDALVAKKVEDAMKKFKESQPVRKALVEEDTEKVVDDSAISKFVVTGMSEPAGPTSEAVQKLHPFGHNETYMEANILGKDVSVSDKREGFTFKEAYTEKYTYTQTGGAGTAGYALIPVYVDPDIIDRTRRELPMVELISRRAVKGLTYDYNAITALTNAVNLAEDASLADLTDTYDRYSISMKYTYSTGRVTGPAIAGMKGYIDAVANEVKQRTLGLKRREDELIFSGDNTTNSEEFDGFDNLISTNNTALGGALTIAAMRTEIDQCHDAGGVVNLICTTKSVETDLKGLLMDYQRYVDTTQLSWGITKISFDGIPVIVDRYATSGYMYFLDTSVIFMAVLQDATYEELAKTNDSNKFTIKMYSALVNRAEAFCSILTGIS